MEVKRVNHYLDDRFNEEVLSQHGAFLIDNQPYSVHIINGHTARVLGKEANHFPALIEAFRFYAEHIDTFLDKNNQIIKQFQPVKLFYLELDHIQPSQFYVDKDKLQAISSFIRKQTDIIIPVTKMNKRWVSLDGHSRLAYAVENGFKTIQVYETAADEGLEYFVKEAIARDILSPYDLKVLTHDEYQVQWNQFCDDYFSSLN